MAKNVSDEVYYGTVPSTPFLPPIQQASPAVPPPTTSQQPDALDRFLGTTASAAPPPPVAATDSERSLQGKTTPAPDVIDRYLKNASSPSLPGAVGPQNRDLPTGSFYNNTFTQATAGLAAGGGDIGNPPPPPPPPGAPPPKDDNSTYDASVDYSKLFDFFGIPSDIKAKIQSIIAQAKGDVNMATPLVLAYVRGTDWYANTYQGIQYGLASGMISNEKDYRQYVDAANQYYRQYLSRDVGTDEIVNAMKEGVGADVLGKRLEGQSYAKAHSGDWQYLAGAFGDGQLSDADVKAYGEESVGLKSALGDRLQEQFDKAQQRMQTIFQGQLATPAGLNRSNGKLKIDNNAAPDVAA